MLGILLTQDSGMLLGPIAKILGYLMEGIFLVLDKVGIPNIGLSIILFTIIINLLMMPLTIKQQKFSKLNAKMQPELQAIQKKYKGKNDNNSVMAMNEETQAVYAKYGVSPTGSCVQLLIQMPILFALYRVIYSVPAYISSVKEAFMPLVNKLLTMEGAVEYMTEIGTGLGISAKKFDFTQANTFVDVLNKFQSSNWTELSAKYPEVVINTDAIVCTIKFINDGEVYNTQNINQGFTGLVPEDPTKPETQQHYYIFNKWVTDEGKPWDVNDPIMRNMTITATYDTFVQQYKVTYQTNSDVILVEPTEVTMYYGDTLAEPTVLGIPEGVTFIGWYTPEGSMWVFDGENATKVLDHITLTARWEDANKPWVTVLRTSYNTFSYEAQDNLGISAWAVGSLSRSRKLYPRPTI